MFFIKGLEYKRPFNEILLSFIPIVFIAVVILIVEFTAVRRMRKKLQEYDENKK